MDVSYKDKILIVGMGVTGENVYVELSHAFEPDTYDIKFPNKERRYDKYGFIFICVDTPYISKENPCDISAIKDVINTWKDSLAPDGIFVLKSTVLPHQIEQLIDEVPQGRLVYSPEYYGATQHCNNFDFNYTILGGNMYACYAVQQMLQNVYDARHQFRIVDPKVASIAKYMENAYLAMKVSFCNQFADICKEEGIHYEDVRELFILDPRVNPSHTFVYDDKPYWDSHCLNKDVKAIAETQNAVLLKNIITFNNIKKTNEKR